MAFSYSTFLYLYYICISITCKDGVTNVGIIWNIPLNIIRWQKFFCIFYFLEWIRIVKLAFGLIYFYSKKSLGGLNNRYCKCIENLTGIRTTKLKGSQCNLITWDDICISAGEMWAFCTESWRDIRLGPEWAEEMYFRLAFLNPGIQWQWCDQVIGGVIHMEWRNENVEISN